MYREIRGRGNSTEIKCDIYSLFEKKFEFRPNEMWTLPNNSFTSKKWSIPLLQQKKFELNNVKGQLNDVPIEEWSKHTKLRDPSSFITPTLKKRFRAELVTQAWCKFYECLAQFDVVPNEAVESSVLPSLHLCEAPGAFITALNHFLVLNYPTVKLQWFGNSLNPYYEGNSTNELIPDDRLIRVTRNRWLFGSDGTGDLTKYYNHEDILKSLADKVWLVTADGSVDCMPNPGEQESQVQFLHYCEIMTALSALHVGGSFVLKIFTMFEESTICQLYLLNCTFQKVHIFKPASSKSGNSEVYVVCLSYRGKETLRDLWGTLINTYKSPESTKQLSMFSMENIDGSFLQQIISCSNYFMNLQTTAINDNLEHFLSQEASDDIVTCRKICVVNYYIERYNVKGIQKFKRISQKNDALNYVALYYRLRNCLAWSDGNEHMVWYTRDTSLNELLRLKTGKSIERVKHSYFSSKTNVADFTVNNFAMDVVVSYLSNSEFCLFKLEDYLSYERQDEFQMAVFDDIRTKVNVDANVVFLQLPFLTSFLVGVLFILSQAYSCVIAHKSGILMLKGFKPNIFVEVKDCLNQISVECNNIMSSDEFKTGIIETVEFMPDSFVNLIWHYNNAVCS